MLKKVILFLLLFAGFHINAAVIEQSGGGYDWQLDESTDLQWLDLTYTDGKSVSQSLSSYSADGWQVATETQFDAMFLYYDSPTMDGSIHGIDEGIFYLDILGGFT